MSLSRPAALIKNTVLRLNSNCSTRNFARTVLKMDENRLIELSRQLAPPLSNDRHKGQAGRIGVFGGSLEYTGAPYFSAISAMKVGADLSYVFCAKEAAPVIKSYSPELIVHPILDAPDAPSQIEPWLERLHVVVIGPGLGRNPETFKVIDEVISMCRARKKPLVIDADGLYYISIKPEILHNYPSHVILTPNVMEFSRLVDQPPSDTGDKKEQARNFLNMADHLTILCKGHHDEIFNKSSHVKVAQGGSGRRCGGQGDLLAGALSIFLAWAVDNCPEQTTIVAGYAACKLARACNEKAFGKYGRSMTCTDMIREIHEVFDELYERK